jgi:hypothetical protein
MQLQQCSWAQQGCVLESESSNSFITTVTTHMEGASLQPSSDDATNMPAFRCLKFLSRSKHLKQA